MIERARRRIGPTDALQIIHGWFDEVLEVEGGFDRIVMDLGVSMVHLKERERGFSFREDGPLDMRLNREGDVPTAEEMLQSISEFELGEIIFRYGEERYSRRIARAICSERPASLKSTKALAECVARAVPAQYRRGRNHPATRTFQAIRIAVNDELGRVERAIPRAAAALNPGGRLIIISFHSLEDRIVKHTFRTLARASIEDEKRPMVKEEGHYAVVTKKPVVPGDDEILRNPASRSAKLRVLEKERNDE